MKLLVTGGAGYIGSVVANQLLARGHEVVVLDDLSRGHRGAVPDGARLIELGLADADGTRDALAEGFDGVLHFAALALVAESVEFPERYHRGNFVGTLNLLDAMREHDVKRLVFSSTCATYGEPDVVPMPETLPTNPVNSYGNSKLAVDRMIGDECRAHGLGAVSLRYFNVAGASGALRGGPLPRDAPDPARPAGRRRHPRARLRVRHRLPDRGRHRGPRLHPRRGPRPRAHARHGRPRAGRHDIYNLGNGLGFSVREVIEAARRVTGREIPVKEEPRRPGDPAQLVASSEKIRAALGWEPEKDLDAMIADAWAWREARPTATATRPAERRLKHRRGRLGGVEHDPAVRLGGRELVVGARACGPERLALPLDAIFRLAAPADPRQRVGRIDPQQQRAVGGQAAGGERVQLADRVDPQARPPPW